MELCNEHTTQANIVIFVASPLTGKPLSHTQTAIRRTQW